VRELQAARGTSIANEATAGLSSRSRLRWLFLAVMLTGLAADLITKTIVVARLDPQEPIRLLGGLVTLRLIRNAGAAFSQGQRFTYIFAITAILVLGFVIIRLVPRLAHAGWTVALGLLCAGVAGNLVDRLFRSPGVLRGKVVDFMQLPYFAVFNVADICITTSAGLIIFFSVIKGVGIGGERPGSEPKADRAQGGG
jgi:signal peptidase II